MNLEPNELSIMKSLIQKTKDHPDDVWLKESLNQYMEDIKTKYKISFSTHNFNMETGEIVKEVQK